MVLENAAGGTLIDFRSAGTGEISAANASGQGGSAVLKDDAANGCWCCAGQMHPTIMDLTMDGT